MQTAKVLNKNLITIPQKVREKMGLTVGDKVVFSEIEGGVFIVKKLDEKRLNEFLLIDTPAEYNVSRKE